MLLEGSCHCGVVRFRVESEAPYPFALCYCSICRKTAGSGGFAIPLSGDAATLRVEGAESVREYQPWMDHPKRTLKSPALRHFCGDCGTALWVSDPRWPELVHPHAGAIDTSLPEPPDRVHALMENKPAWVVAPVGPRDATFPEYPDTSLHDWHAERGLLNAEGD